MSEQDHARLGRYAAMLRKDDDIDRHQCHRTVPMQVLALGFSRTGTLCMYPTRPFTSKLVSTRRLADNH